jgi:ppGpp synthetase/RelA/SpoT-type nucleotidyltranferase
MKISLLNSKRQSYETIRKALLKDRSVHIRGLPSIKRLIRRILEDNGIEHLVVQGRVKELESAIDKVLRKGPSYSIGDLTDLICLRIILYQESDIEKVAELLKNSFNFDPENSVDKTKPQEITSFGYRSLHLILRMTDTYGVDHVVEVQIRTVLQHAWAELEHSVIYKSGHKPSDVIKRDFARLSGTLELLDREIDRILQSAKQRNEKG